MEKYVKNAIRGLMTGLLSAPFITLFSNLVTWANEYNSKHRFLILFLPIGALLIIFTYHLLGYQSKKITSMAISQIHYGEDGNTDMRGEGRITLKMAATSFFNSVLSHFLGASVGKEGVGVQIGFAAGSILDQAEERLLGSSRRDYYLISGASSAFSTLFGAPAAGTLFGLHMASPRLSRIDALLPAICSSFSSYLFSQAIGIHVISVPSFKALELNIINTATVFLFAVIIGLACSFSCKLLEFFKERLNELYPGSEAFKAIIPAVLLTVFSIVIFIITGRFWYNGLSVDLISLSMLRDAGFWDFIIKLVMVLLSLAAGFQGGEVVPLLVLGATFTSSLASLFSLDSAAYAILGAIGFLSAGTKLPFVTFALGMELFGYTEPALLFLMTSISLLSSGKTGIYSHQRIY